MSELRKLKRKAKRLYLKAESFGDMSCGRHMAEYIRPGIGGARQEFNKIWARVRELDPTAPPSPYD